MPVEGIASAESCYEGYESDDETIGSWDGKKVEILDSDVERVFFPRVVSRTSMSPHEKFIEATLLSKSVGGSVSAEKNKDGSGEISVEGHGSVKSEDGKTSVSANGKASVDDKGQVSGKIEAKIEHEF